MKHMGSCTALVLAASIAAQDVVKQPRPPQTGPDTKVAVTPPVKWKDPVPHQVPAGLVPVKDAIPVKHAGSAGVPAATVSLDGTFYQVDGDGNQWIWRQNYKARVGSEAMTFYPFLGADQPITWVEFRRPEVRIAAVSLANTDHRAVRKGDRISIDRGAYTEHYDVGDAGLEQSFEFASLPARGELFLEIPIRGPLAAEFDAGVVTFANERGGVRYGRAVAFDGAGHRVEVATEWRKDSIGLTVPEAFVASATLPLIVDPLISPLVRVATGPPPVMDSDIAYEANTGRYIVVYQVDYAANDQDVFGSLRSSDLTTPVLNLVIDGSLDCWERPRVASNALAQNFCVVAQVSADCSSPFWISGVLVDAASGLIGPVVDVARASVSGHFQGDKLNPDVGGDPSPFGPTYYTVVWERVSNATDHDIHMKQLTGQGALRSAAPTLIDNGLGFESHPCISKSDGLPPAVSQDWAVVYQRTYTGGGSPEEDIYGSLVSWDGALAVIGTSTIFPVNTWSNDDWLPSVSSPTDGAAPRRFLVAYERRAANRDIVITTFDRQAQLLVSADLHALEGVGSVIQSWDQTAPVVDSDGCQFVISYTEAYLNTADLDVHASTLMVDPGTGQPLMHGTRSALAASSDVESASAIVALRGSGGPRLDYALCWQNDLAAAPGIIEAALFGGYAAGQQFSYRSTGCGTLVLDHQGAAAIGGELQFTLTGSTGFLGFVLGAPLTLPVPLCAGCTIGVSGDTISGASFSATVPCRPGFVGLSFALQGFAFGPAGSGPCLNKLQLSDTLDIVVR